MIAFTLWRADASTHYDLARVADVRVTEGQVELIDAPPDLAGIVAEVQALPTLVLKTETVETLPDGRKRRALHGREVTPEDAGWGFALARELTARTGFEVTFDVP
jgi:hypothetical protein